MLEGLEITELRLSKLVEDNQAIRIDSEFNLKEHLAIIVELKAKGAIQLSESNPTIIHPHEIVREYVEDSGIWFFRAQNVRPLEISDTDKVLISQTDALTLQRNRLHVNDVLITRTGANAGDCALFDLHELAVASSHTFIVRTETWSPHYLVAFLNTRHGRSQIMKGRYGAAQPEVAPAYLRNIWIPRFGRDFYSVIEDIFNLAKTTRHTATKNLLAAEQALLRALGLENWQPPEPLTYTRRASEALSVERLDSDYFAPRVSELLKKLSEPGLTIGAVAPARHERFSPGKDGEFDYIEIGSLRADGTADSERLPQSEAPSRASQIVRAGDVLTSSVRPIRRLSALVMPEQDGYVCSSGFVVLRPSTVPAEVLLTYLRLPVVCELMDLHASASLYPAISEADLLALPYHPIAKDAEAEIVQAVQSAHAARRQAHALLEAAKRAVEIAIEESEAAALAYLADIETKID